MFFTTLKSGWLNLFINPGNPVGIMDISIILSHLKAKSLLKWKLLVVAFAVTNFLNFYRTITQE